MASKPQTDEEILAEMEAIDQLELKGGIAAASPEAKAKAETAKAEADEERSKPKYKMPGLSRERLGYQ